MAEVTNYIDRLVAELCPDGVEYRPLGEIADVTSGYVFPVKYQGNEKSAEDNIPFYKVSDMNLPGNEMFMTSSNNYVSAESAKEMRASLAQPESIIFPKIGAAIATNKKRILTEKSIVDNNVMVVTARSVINSKFLYYVLSAFDLMSWSMGAGAVPSIKKSVVVKHEVPVPPLEIQEAIVEILDKFTNLEAELEAELEARTLQYEYYRGSLFGTLKDPATGLPAIAGLVKTLCPDGVEYRSLKDVVAKNYGGGTPSKSKAEYWDGNIPWASVGDLSDDVLEVTDTRSKITEEGVKGSSTNIVPAGAVIVAIKINPGRMKIAGMNLAINQDIRGLVLNDSMNARFLTYYFRTLMFAGHGTIVKSITNKHLMETKIPVPPMEIQQRIVDILDRFDALTSSLSEGLPAELATRRSQYEYYRDQLLTFPRKGENQ